MLIEEIFTYHAPNAEQVKKYAEIRRLAKEFASYLCSNSNQSHELTMAVDHLRTAVMWANANVAINEKSEKEPF